MAIKAKGLLMRVAVTALVVIAFVSSYALVLISSRSYEAFLFQRIAFTATSESQAVHSQIRSYLEQGTRLSTDLFTEREILHMRDVTTLVDVLRVVVFLSLTLLLCIRFVARVSTDEWRICLASALGCIVGSVVILGMAGFYFFDQLFTLFHKLLFTNDLWLLDPSQHALIRAYPPEFFSAFFLYGAIALFVLCSIGLILVRLKK